VKIMNKVATADEEDSMVAKVVKFAAEFDMPREAAGMVEADLKDGKFGGGVHMTEDAPGAVVVTPFLIGREVMFAGQTIGEFWCAGGRDIALRRGAWGSHKNREW
jgi:hypothetical protein